MIGDDRNMTFIPQINIYLGSVMMYSVFFMQLLERLWETCRAKNSGHSNVICLCKKGAIFMVLLA